MSRLDRIASARTAAIEALACSTGADSLCTLARERLPAAKYHEGAAAALGDAYRAERAGRPLPDPAEWGVHLEARAAASAAWRAYLVGGREALVGALAGEPRGDLLAATAAAPTGSPTAKPVDLTV